MRVHLPIRSLGDSFRRWGLRRTLLAAFYGRVMRKMGVHLYEIHVRALAQTHVTISNPSGFVFRQVSAEELQRATEDLDMNIEAPFVEEALARGDLCFGAFDGERLIAYAWRAFTTAPHRDGVTVCVYAPYCYTYKVFTRAEYRGREAWPALSGTSDQICVARARNRMVGIIEVDNFASARAAEKLGATRVGYAGFVRCVGRNFVFHSRGTRRTRFRFVA